MKEIIHFAHGNGFPSMCYRQFLTALAPKFEVCFIDKVGHNPTFSVTETWMNLVKEVAMSIEQQAPQPVIAVGHSLGGVLSLLAAIEHPELIKAVILLDSPLLGRVKSSLVRLAKALGVIDRITPAYRTRGRREFWKDRNQVEKYLKSRELFKTFAPECLQDYIDYGLMQTSEGYRLQFDKHIEYQIYRTLPHQLHNYGGQLKVPAAVIYGLQSTVVDRYDLKYMKRNFGIDAYAEEGTHMLPMEHPNQVASKVILVIDDLLKRIDTHSSDNLD